MSTALVVALGGPAAGAAEAPEPLRAVAGPGGAVELWRGNVRLGGAVLTTPAGQRGPARARLLQVEGRPVVELRVPIQNAGKGNAARAASGGERTEVWIGEQAASGLRRLHGEVVGPRDADGETRTEAAVTSEGIFQFQTAARLVRCSGAPMRLGLRRYDFGRGRFVDSADLPPPVPTVLDAAPEATEATRARPRVQFPFALTSAPAADDAPGPVDPRRLVAPLPLSDGDPATVWLSRGARGETLTARAASAGHQVTGLRLWPADTRSRARLLATTRPRQLYLELGPSADQRFEVRLDPAVTAADAHRRPLWVALPKPVPSSCVSLSVREVTPGSDGRNGDLLAWGDVEIFTDLGRTGGERAPGAVPGADRLREPDRRRGGAGERGAQPAWRVRWPRRAGRPGIACWRRWDASRCRPRPRPSWGRPWHAGWSGPRPPRRRRWWGCCSACGKRPFPRSPACFRTARPTTRIAPGRPARWRRWRRPRPHPGRRAARPRPPCWRPPVKGPRRSAPPSVRPWAAQGWAICRCFTRPLASRRRIRPR